MKMTYAKLSRCIVAKASNSRTGLANEIIEKTNGHTNDAMSAL